MSALPDDEVQKLLESYREVDKSNGKKTVVGSVYDDEYMKIRRRQEYMTRTTFIEKGDKPVRQAPFYMMLRDSDVYEDGILDWYSETDCIKIPVEEFNMDTVSFTYGDQCQTCNPARYEEFLTGKFRPNIFTFKEIVEVINERGWIPFVGTSDWSKPWYIEAQVWSDDEFINKYRNL